MDTAQFWVGAVLQLGVPTVALYFVAKWVSKRIEDSDKAAAAREISLATAAEKREQELKEQGEKREQECRAEQKKLTQDVRNLEREMRSEMVPLIKDTRRALEHSTANSRQLVHLVAKLVGRSEEELLNGSPDQSDDQGTGQAQGSSQGAVRPQQNQR